MAISKSDSKKMQRLAQEGKPISKIMTDDFPDVDYWEIYLEVHGGGQRSALGVKRTITNRLTEITKNPNRVERDVIANELNELVWHLYNNHKTNQEKLAKIRKALEE